MSVYRITRREDGRWVLTEGSQASAVATEGSLGEVIGAYKKSQERGELTVIWSGREFCSEEELLDELESQSLCPHCMETLTSRLGSGRKADGIFCSLSCYFQYHRTAIIQRIPLSLGE